jgi:hypothetical protein
MKLIVPALAALVVVFAMTVAAPAEAQKRPGKGYQSAQVNKTYKKSRGPLKGVIYGNRRRVGGYSYSYSDVIRPGRFANHPAATGLHDSGVIDSDFFYPRPSGPFGGYTPYMN